VHGSLLDEDQYVLTVRDAWQPLCQAQTRINFFGHTHVQGGFATNGHEWFRLTPQYHSRDEVESYDLQLRDGARYMLNPGSVGQPRDGDWRAAFALYDDVARMVTFYRVPYDVRLTQMRIIGAGLPDRLATRLREGR
jgi:diadenosine tetraphosphatase ApaH/serine/threonine PP2A family protein phosphatase